MNRKKILVLVLLFFGIGLVGAGIVIENISLDWGTLKTLENDRIAEISSARADEFMPRLFDQLVIQEERIELLESELCKKDNTYSWCER